MQTFVFLSALLLAGQVEAFWRLPCNNPVIVERGDPIVSPGAVSGHVHTISGGSNFGLSVTFDDLRASDCTSCLVKQDMSNYWTPQLYFQWANGSFTSVDQVGGGLIYYLQRNNTPTEEILAFPDGMRILTGNPFLRSYNSSSLMAQAIGLNCLGANVAATRQPYLPPYNCPDGLRGEVRFPSCWDGVNIDSSDHFSHMAYPLDNESGPCPTSHPKRVVTLFYEMMWSVDPWKNLWSQAMNTSQPFVFAMGDPTGYGYHGDFLNGWDGAVLQQAINECTDDSGVIQDCPVFDLYDQNDHSCQKTPDVNEIVLGTLPSLPGCNLVPGPTYPSNCPGMVTPATFNSSVAYTGEAPPPGSNVLANQPQVVESFGAWKYVDCFSDNVNNTRSLSHGLTNANGTVEGCLNACATAGYSMCGIEYYGECWGANTLYQYSTPIGYGQCGYACKGNSLQYCGGSNAFDLYISNTTTVSSTSTTTTSTSTTKSSSITTAGATRGSAPTTTKVSSVSTTTTKSTTTTTTTVAASKTPAAVTTNAKWAYQGCFADNVNSNRQLPFGETGSANYTVESCLSACDALGYPVAGLEYYGECYCGTALPAASTPLSASSCNYACKNNAAEACGGSNALSVYYSTVTPRPTWPTTPILQTWGNWTYKACMSDLVNNQRSLTSTLSFNNTIEGCLAACSTAGSTVCALSYGGECWQTKTNISFASTVIANSSCTMPCKGNGLEYCGGSAALLTYFPTPKTATIVAAAASRGKYTTKRDQVEERDEGAIYRKALARRRVELLTKLGWENIV